MHPSNRYYGHDVILSWAASFRSPRPIFGYVQHGWKPEQAVHLSSRPLPRAPFFVWSKANLAPTKAIYRGHPATAIGAPFLYLHRMAFHGASTVPEKDLLIYPCHGLANYQVPLEVHSALVNRALDLVDSTSTVTVNLHPREYGDASVESIYRAFRNVEFSHNWMPEPYSLYWDPLTYVRQVSQILNHSRVVSNCLTTALFYAGYLERLVYLTEHPSRRPRSTEGRGADLHRAIEADSTGRLLSEIAPAELGVDCMLSPADLRRALGWEGGVVSKFRSTLTRCGAGVLYGRVK